MHYWKFAVCFAFVATLHLSKVRNVLYFLYVLILNLTPACYLNIFVICYTIQITADESAVASEKNEVEDELYQRHEVEAYPEDHI